MVITDWAMTKIATAQGMSKLVITEEADEFNISLYDIKEVLLSCTQENVLEILALARDAASKVTDKKLDELREVHLQRLQNEMECLELRKALIRLKGTCSDTERSIIEGLQREIKSTGSNAVTR